MHFKLLLEWTLTQLTDAKSGAEQREREASEGEVVGCGASEGRGEGAWYIDLDPKKRSFEKY